MQKFKKNTRGGGLGPGGGLKSRLRIETPPWYFRIRSTFCTHNSPITVSQKVVVHFAPPLSRKNFGESFFFAPKNFGEDFMLHFLGNIQYNYETLCYIFLYPIPCDRGFQGVPVFWSIFGKIFSELRRMHMRRMKSTKIQDEPCYPPNANKKPTKRNEKPKWLSKSQNC